MEHKLEQTRLLAYKHLQIYVRQSLTYVVPFQCFHVLCVTLVVHENCGMYFFKAWSSNIAPKAFHLSLLWLLLLSGHYLGVLPASVSGRLQSQLGRGII